MPGMQSSPGPRLQLHPRHVINQLAIWQAATFDPKEIGREPGWALGSGMNTVRVFLRDRL